MGRQHVETVIQEVISSGGKCFVPYIMAGDGGLEQLVPRLEFLQKAGATMIEIGIPFSDPAADGPIIQQAGLRALKKGTTIMKVLNELEHAREKVSIPLLFMTYLNPILSIGIKNFAQRCEEIGIDGCIIPDVPLEEEHEIRPVLQQHQLAFIRLASIVSPPERLQQISNGAEGFLYAVTVKGVTGVRKDFEEDVSSYVRHLKEMSSVPVLAGFGISTPKHVANMCSNCDGVIVGSQIIHHFQQGEEHLIEPLIAAAK